MRDIPECLRRRYNAMDELIKELGTYGTSNHNLDSSSDDPEIKLMCEFWNILKDDPGVNLKQAVQQRMGPDAISRGLFGQNVELYRAGCCKKDKEKKPTEETGEKNKNPGCKGSKGSSQTTPPCKIIDPKTCSSNTLPLNKVLFNLKEAASFEKNCAEKVKELLKNQKQLQDQIVILEQREKDGMQMLKQVDCMWSSMEESYKRKIAECLERQTVFLTQLKEVEANNKKWRNNKKDLEFEMDRIIQCHREIIEQINHKTNDVKCIDLEISNFQNRIESDNKDIQVSLKSLSNKKQSSDAKMATMGTDIAKLEKLLIQEQKYNVTKQQEGTKYVKDARQDLQYICKVLLQKKLENEDMKAEREALILEFEMLKENCDQCREICRNKEESIIDEIKTIEKEIADSTDRCTRCHECTDTIDVRRFCTDCPRCANEQDCLQEEGHCSPDHATDCVCMTVKQKFLDNVFDNMYTLLERQVKSGQGKVVAEAVMNCLKKSRNGKINDKTKKMLQEFILTTVKKHLKLTIVGGAVKTRCEMDPETYKQLMVCLREVKVTKSERVDKGTDSKKPPCKRWEGTNECNCPGGPKACVCIGKGILPSIEAQSFSPSVQDEEDIVENIVCPHRHNAPCGADCAAHDSVGSEVAAWRPNPCQGATCNFKNMRAAQCVLGPEVLLTASGPRCIRPSVTPSPILEKPAVCKCSGVAKVACICRKDLRSQPRERIIQEVMGRYTDVTPIEKVVSMDGNIRISNEERNLTNGRVSEISLLKQKNLPNTSYKSYQYCNCSLCSWNSTDHKNNIEYKNRSGKKKYQNIKHIYNNRRKASNKNVFKRNKKTKLSREINMMRDKSNEDIVTNKLSKYKIEDKHENICNEVNDLMREVIIFDGDVKLNVKHEWSSLTSFSNEVAVLTQITSDESHVTIQEEQLNEVLCTIEPFNQDNISILIDNEIKIIYINDKYNSKQLKAGIADVSDKNKCETNVKSVNSRGNIQDNNKHISSDNMLVPQYNKDLPTKQPKVVYDEKIKLPDTTKILKKTSSGGLKVALNQKFLETLNKKMKHNCNLCTKVKDTNASEDFVDRSDQTVTKSKISDGKATVLAKKTQYGNIFLDIDKSTYNATKDNKKDCTTPSEILNVKVKGARCNEQEPLFALKATDSGNYEVVFDKEFEKCYKQTIKNYQGEDDKQFMPLTKTDSGNFVIDLENNNLNQLVNTSALMVKSESGNIKVIMNAGESESSRKVSRSKSIISARTLNDLLKKLPISSTQFHKENIKKSRLRSERSISDSQVYGKTKFNFQNEYNFPSEQTLVLQKTCSGEYAVVLNKDSKKSFINNLKSYLTISSKGLVPIQRTDSGNIYVDLSNNAHNLSNYGSVKITPSGNIYITFDEKAFPSNIINTSNQNIKTTSNHQLFSIKKSSSRSIEATTCKPRDINNTSEYNLKKLCFKSKKCLLQQYKDGSSETHPCGKKCLNIKKHLTHSPGKGNEHKKSKSKCLNNLENIILENKSPHIVIKPCRYILDKASTKDCYRFIQSICPYHIDRYEKISNDLLEISGLCCNEHNRKGNNLLHGGDKFKRCPLEWDSLQYLPPQLPSFLRDYNRV